LTASFEILGARGGHDASVVVGLAGVDASEVLLVSRSARRACARAADEERDREEGSEAHGAGVLDRWVFRLVQTR
jgi:hypothetical protein